MMWKFGSLGLGWGLKTLWIWNWNNSFYGKWVRTRNWSDQWTQLKHDPHITQLPPSLVASSSTAVSHYWPLSTELSALVYCVKYPSSAAIDGCSAIVRFSSTATRSSCSTGHSVITSFPNRYRALLRLRYRVQGWLPGWEHKPWGCRTRENCWESWRKDVEPRGLEYQEPKQKE